MSSNSPTTVAAPSPSQVQASQLIREKQAIVFEKIRRDKIFWMRKVTRTSNPHWIDQGQESPFQPFPDYRAHNPDGIDYIDLLIDFLKPRNEMIYDYNRARVPPDPFRGARERGIVKSRTMLGSWICVAHFVHEAMVKPGLEFLFQSQVQEKAQELIDYAKTLWREQPSWVRAEFELDRRLDDLPMDLIQFKNRSRIVAIPSDPDKVRAYHPSGMLMDECSFLDQFYKNRETALPACRLIVELSSAGPSEFGEFVTA